MSSSSSTTTCSDSVCSICLDTCSVTSFADGCLHKFCGRCIFEWAQRSQLCPICRTFFANIITNVTSDTEYEVIPLEDRRVPVPNFIRDSWWSNNFSRNRNIFAVRQTPQRTSQMPSSSQHQSTSTIQSALSHPPSSSSRPISRASGHQQEMGQFIDQTTRRMEDHQIDHQPRQRRIIWSNRYSNRQLTRHQLQSEAQILPEPDQLPPQVQSQIPPSQPQSQPIPNYYDRAQNQFVNNSRNSFNSRPLRPLVGVRQDNHQNQHQYQHQHQHHHQQYQQQQHPNHHFQNHHHPSSHHHLNSNCHLTSSQSHLSYGPNQHYSNHIHPHPHHEHPHPNFNPHATYPNYKRISRPNDRQRRR